MVASRDSSLTPNSDNNDPTAKLRRLRRILRLRYHTERAAVARYRAAAERTRARLEQVEEQIAKWPKVQVLDHHTGNVVWVPAR
jgi:hypothetical protein